MYDLIDRQALLEKKIRIPIARIVTEDKIIYRDVVFVKDIEALPSAEPEIIRCRACKHHILHKRLNVPWCRLLHIDMGNNQFCSCAERREEDE